MILSHQHKFIFVAIPKTATHAIRVALRPHLGSQEWEQCRLFVDKRFPIPSIARLRHGHITCMQLQQALPERRYSPYFKFCIVRNPYDRFVSYCYFLYGKSWRMKLFPKHTMKRIFQNPKTPRHILFRPQHEFVSDEAGALLVDKIGRYESLQSDFDAICQRLGLPKQPLPMPNASRHPPYQQCYDQELQEKVQAFYRRDFELFDYPIGIA